MATYRKTPDFYSPGALDSFAAGAFVLPFAVLILPVLLSAEMKSFISWIGFLLGLVMELFFGLSAVLMIGEGFLKLSKKQAWKKQALTAHTRILKQEANVRYEDDYNKYGPFWRLYLEMTPGQLAGKPDETIVLADVSKALYKRYVGKDQVRIYCAPEDAFVFLIQGEL